MKVIQTEIHDVLIIEPKVFGDHRGFFAETFRADQYAEVGINLPFVQDNHSRSTKGVLRGLHYQLNNPQGKLVRVSSGTVYDVAVDIRVGSPTFGKAVGVMLDETSQRQLWVPPGLAHGFCVVSDTADFQYKCTDFYAPDDDYGIAWDDPALAIDWPIDDPILSDKDLKHPMLANAPQDRLPRYENTNSLS